MHKGNASQSSMAGLLATVCLTARCRELNLACQPLNQVSPARFHTWGYREKIWDGTSGCVCLPLLICLCDSKGEEKLEKQCNTYIYIYFFFFLFVSE